MRRMKGLNHRGELGFGGIQMLLVYRRGASGGAEVRGIGTCGVGAGRSWDQAFGNRRSGVREVELLWPGFRDAGI